MGMGACVSFVLGAGSLLIDAGPLRSQPVCTIDGSVESCEATLIGTALTVVRADGSVIRTKRLGRCGSDQGSDGTTQRCTVRIEVPNDFVYGLQVLKPQGAIELIAPIFRIELDGVNRAAE